MYNDYYLQLINGELQEVNTNLETIIENQEEIISGDKTIRTNQEVITANIMATNVILLMALIYTFITRCFRC